MAICLLKIKRFHILMSTYMNIWITFQHKVWYFYPGQCFAEWMNGIKDSKSDAS